MKKHRRLPILDRRVRKPADYFTLDRAALEVRWLNAFRRAEVPELSLDLLARALAFNVQEITEGAASTRLRNKLVEYADDLDHHGVLDLHRGALNRPGARFIRKWRGQVHEVVVLDKGYLWRGTRYRSLTAIATLITGTRFSGPTFFHVRKRRVRNKVAPFSLADWMKEG